MEDINQIIAQVKQNLDKLIELNNLSLNKIASENPEHVKNALEDVAKIKKAMGEGDINTLNDIRGKYANYDTK